MREDMIGCAVVEKATGKRLGRLAAWGTWTLEDGVEPCAVVVGDGGAVFSYGLPGLRLAMPSPAKAHSLKIRAQMEQLRRERDSLAEELRILEGEHESFMREDDEACRLVGKGEDETLPAAILRALAAAREEGKNA